MHCICMCFISSDNSEVFLCFELREEINMKTKKLVRMALLIAMSYVGAYIKPFPGPVATAAFDSMPGFFAAAWLSPIEGFIIGALGHIFTAMLQGFYLTIPVHLLIAVEMGLICFVFGWLWKKTKIGAIIVSSLLNGVASPLSLVVFPHLTIGVLWAMVPVLLFASVANIVVAAILAKTLPENLKKI